MNVEAGPDARRNQHFRRGPRPVRSDRVQVQDQRLPLSQGVLGHAQLSGRETDDIAEANPGPARWGRQREDVHVEEGMISHLENHDLLRRPSRPHSSAGTQGHNQDEVAAKARVHVG